MKKLFLLLVGLSAVAFTSCNSKSESYVQVIGSLESNFMTNKIVLNDGTVLVPASTSGVRLPSISDGLSRERINVAFTFAGDARPSGDGKPVEINLIETVKIETKLPVGLGDLDEEEFDGSFLPVPEGAGFLEGNYYAFMCYNNYLDLWYFSPLYTKNKVGDQPYTIPVVELEIDPTIQQPEKAGDPEIINVWVRINPKRGADDKGNPEVSVGTGVGTISFDLEDVPSEFGFPIGTSSDPKTYQIVVHYSMYPDKNADDDKAEMKTAKTLWTPASPFVKAQ